MRERFVGCRGLRSPSGSDVCEFLRRGFPVFLQMISSASKIASWCFLTSGTPFRHVASFNAATDELEAKEQWQDSPPEAEEVVEDPVGEVEVE